ncbi:MAG: GNAT family N-acetyltransferase [Pedobacter sp.]|nr:MAG: GNAT family N-acetyltransferase [Pedobacter sp.]
MTTPINFISAKTSQQIALCRDVLFAFRTNLEEDTYIDKVLKMIEDERFHLVYIPAEDQNKAAAFIGYRVMHTLRTGWMIYIDDLYTDPAYRGRGYAGELLDYVDRQAEAEAISSVHLDSGYMLHAAHRLYLNKNYVLACNHFAKNVVPNAL